VELRLNPAPLIVPDPWENVKAFFTLDGSIKYDNYIASGVSPTDRVIDEDITAINTSMSARLPTKTGLELWIVARSRS